MLARIALFNSAALFLDQLAVIAISLVLTPVLISMLGMAAFGIWLLLLRGSTFVSLFDGRAHETLKWQIARAPDSPYWEKRRLVGANLIVWVTYLPLITLCGLVFFYWAGTLGEREMVSLSRETLYLAAALMSLNAILIGLRTFPESILKGSNKGYKSIGVRTSLLIASGLVSICVVKAGYGLVALALVQIVFTVLTGIVYLLVTRKNIPWVGISKPLGEQIGKARRLGRWYFAWSLINFSFFSIDVLLLGALSTTISVSRFVVTYYAIKMITGAISTILSAILPGLGILIGKGKKEMAEKIRRESVLYCWWLAFAIGLTILLVNRSFVRLWIGEDVYAGSLENTLIVIMAIQMVFIRNDSLVINLALEQKEKVKVTLYSLVLIVLLSLLLIPKYGIVGMCLSLIIGRLVLNYYYPLIIAGFFATAKNSVFSIVSLKGWLAVLIIFVVVLFSDGYLEIDNWPMLIMTSGSVFTSVLLVLFVAGFDPEQKQIFYGRLRNLGLVRQRGR